ncbi:ABC-2 family transporter protein [Corynebacterium faecale]|uniref:multidrug ABC transporter permease n=1 Tax=Corynebacterium faecale TaxID=1758466 RepID=UPI0025B4AC22|nr:multidrug ABC transporter permease [Corynebacterium faecale]WJY93181.1 ABC-2 family transporter protein [Corynebacterium faecale]
MFLNVLRSEWTKLITTRSFWWTSVLFILLGVGFAALTGSFATGEDLATTLLLAGNTVSGLYIASFIVVIVQAVMVFTTEFRYGYQQYSFLATPKRSVVALAKWLLYALLAMVITFITVLLCFYVAKALASEVASSTLDVWNDNEALRIMWQYPVGAALLVTFSSGVALLLRQSAGAITLILMWHLALEDLAGLLPRVGEFVGKYGPFTNLRSYITGFQTSDPGWGPEFGAVYFGIWAVVLFIAGIVVLEKRDA